MDNIILIILIILLLFGGGWGAYSYRSTGAYGLPGIFVTILFIILIVYLLRMVPI